MNQSKDTDSVADNFKKLYGPLPPEIDIKCPSSVNSDAVNTNSTKLQTNKDVMKNISASQNELECFLKNNLPRSDHKEIGDELRKTYPLYKQKGGKIKKPQPKRKGKYLTSHERWNLGLNRLPKSGGLKFCDYTELNNMWQEYMRDLLGWKDPLPVTKKSKRPKESESNSSQIINVGDEQFRMRICRADYHGAFIKITKSKCPSQLGVQGYVVMETRNTLQLLTEKDEIKLIPKSGTSFSFCLNNHLFTVSGSNFCLKPSERAVKKWKNKPPYDL